MNQTPEEWLFLFCNFCWCSSLLFIFFQCSFWQKVGTFCHSVFLQQHGTTWSSLTNIILCLKINVEASLPSYSPPCCLHPLFTVSTLFLSMQLQTCMLLPGHTRQCSLSTALCISLYFLNHSTVQSISPLMVSPSEDPGTTPLAHESLVSLCSLVSIQVEYSWFSLFVVVMFYRVVCDTEYRWCWTIGLRGNTALCLVHLWPQLLVPLLNTQPCGFYVNFHIKMAYLIICCSVAQSCQSLRLNELQHPDF